MRSRLVVLAGAVAAMVVIAFLVPLAFLVRDLARDRALSTAERNAQIVAQNLSLVAALMLYQATADRTYINEAELLCHAMIANHWDENAGGFYFASGMAENLIVRSKYAHDDATRHPKTSTR